MSGKGKKEEDKEEVRGHGPEGFAALCESMMAAGPREGCASQMRAMMARCMANFPDEQKEPN